MLCFSRTPTALKRAAFFGCALAIAASGGQVQAQTASTGFVPFGQFIQETKGASSTDYLGHPQIQVRDAAAFEEMRQGILARYDGVTVTHSFMVGGEHYDCVPTMQQPAVRTYGLKSIAEAPPGELLKSDQPTAQKGALPATQVDAAAPFDAFGNLQHCEANTVPLERATLDTLTRFATLQDFYRKGPSGPVAVASEDAISDTFADPSVYGHRSLRGVHQRRRGAALRINA